MMMKHLIGFTFFIREIILKEAKMYESTYFPLKKTSATRQY